MAKRSSDADIVAHLNQLSNQPQQHPHRVETGGMVLNKPPSGPSLSIEDMLANEARASKAVDEAHRNVKIPLNLIDDSPYQPRNKYDESAIEALGMMLKDAGQLELITVREKAGGRFELISGHRRTRAARLIGWSDIDGRIISVDDKKAELATLVSNEGRIDLTDYERGKTYMRSIDRGFAKTQSDVARMFGCTQGRVSQCLTMLKLPEPILGLLEEHPGLFGFRYCVGVIDLVKEYPAHIQTITDGVSMLIESPELVSQDLKRYVTSSLNKRTRSSPVKPISIQTLSGIEILSVKATEKQIIIDISEKADPALIRRRILAASREYVTDLEVTEGTDNGPEEPLSN